MVGWILLGTVSMYQANSTSEFAIAAKWQMNFVVLYLIAFFWFSSAYTGFKHPIFLWFFSILCVMSWFVNLFSETSILFSEIHGLRILDLPWGEKVTFVQGEVSHWSTFHYVISLICVVYTYIGCWFQYRKGDRRPALLLAFCLSIILLTVVHDFLVDSLVIKHFYITDFGFLPLILIVYNELSSDFRKKSQALRLSQ